MYYIPVGQFQGHLIGDSGYACQRVLLTPFLHPTLPCYERYNKSLVTTRVIIEQCNGVIKRRFPCIGGCMRITNLTTVSTITTSCGILHNIGLDRNDIFPIVRENRDEDMHVVPYDGRDDGKNYREFIANTYFNWSTVYLSRCMYLVSLDVCIMYL